MSTNIQPKARDTRCALLTTAMDLIWTYSFGAVAVDDICKKAGVQKGSFYHFFRSKAELAGHALDNLWEVNRPILDHVFSPQVPGLERLRNYAELTLQQQVEDQKRLGFVVGCPFSSVGSEQMSQEDGVTAKAWDILTRFRKYFIVALRDACEANEISLDDYEASANEVFNHYLGCLVVSRLSGNLDCMENLYERWCSILGIKPGDRVKQEQKTRTTAR